MVYQKPHKTHEAQADLIISRGLEAQKDELINKLKSVNYYRFSAYLYPFRAEDNQGNKQDTFKPNTSLEKVWRCYSFDRDLRFIILDAIERIEISIKTKLSYLISERYGAFGYLESKNFNDRKKHKKLISNFKKDINRQHEEFIIRFLKKTWS